MAETMIPILPCTSIDETLEFYGALGFEVTYRQERPNTYAVVQRGGMVLHLFVMKGLDPETSFSTCYVETTDVETLYEAFSAGLRETYGRVPLRGVPRMNPIKETSDGVRQFIVVDPGGNFIRIGQPPGIDEVVDVPRGRPKEIERRTGPRKLEVVRGGRDRPLSRLERAVETAVRLGEGKGDHPAAATLLDRALTSNEPVPDGLLFRALTLRADLAVRMGEDELAMRVIDDLDQIPLTEDDLVVLAEDVQRVEELRDYLIPRR
jgi:catechol 2,3-dioxygenase-like lactoylglutathione lyase family enzyme